MLLIYIFRLIRKKNESYESGIIPFSSDAKLQPSPSLKDIKNAERPKH